MLVFPCKLPLNRFLPTEQIILCEEYLQRFHFVFFSRNISTGTPEVMVNFVTSCYKPDLLMPLVDNITKIPEVVCNMSLVTLIL